MPGRSPDDPWKWQTFTRRLNQEWGRLFGHLHELYGGRYDFFYTMEQVLDFVFNHTSDEHVWALRAKAGDPEFMDYYHTFVHRDEADRYQADLREIFPDRRQRSFTWSETLQRRVWTTFNGYPGVALFPRDGLAFPAAQTIARVAQW
jgi:hypothetical protein